MRKIVATVEAINNGFLITDKLSGEVHYIKDFSPRSLLNISCTIDVYIRKYSEDKGFISSIRGVRDASKYVLGDSPLQSLLEAKNFMEQFRMDGHEIGMATARVPKVLSSPKFYGSIMRDNLSEVLRIFNDNGLTACDVTGCDYN